MKKFLLLFIIFPIASIAQEFKLLKKTNDVEVFYKISKIGETDKNDKYVLEINYKNISDKDIFYSSTPTQGKSQTTISNFATINLPQVTSWASQYDLEITGEKTKLSVEGNQIYFLKSAKEFSKSVEFRIKKGLSPIVTIETNEKVVLKNNLYDFL